jgi:hypothetical protein
LTAGCTASHTDRGLSNRDARQVARSACVHGAMDIAELLDRSLSLPISAIA